MPKLSDQQYRDAADRMYGGPLVSVSRWGAIHRMSDGGAFVEMTVWVPDTAVDVVGPVPEKPIES